MVRRLVAGAVIAIGMAALVFSSPVDTVGAEPPPMDECMSCHLAKVPIEGVTRPKVLRGHDILGEGNLACMVCHDKDNEHLGLLNLVDDITLITKAEPSQLCGLCHEIRFKAWQAGTHGSAEWKQGEPGYPGATRKTCIACHDPHQPQIVLAGITLPHPEPAPPPASIPGTPFKILGVVLLAVISFGTAVAVAGKGG